MFRSSIVVLVVCLAGYGVGASAEVTPTAQLVYQMGTSKHQGTFQLSSGFSDASYDVNEHPVFLPLMQASFSSVGFKDASVLGRPLNASDDNGSSGSSNWVWWTLGGLGIAGIAVAASSHHHQDSAPPQSGGTVCGNNDVLLGNNCVPGP